MFSARVCAVRTRLSAGPEIETPRGTAAGERLLTPTVPTILSAAALAIAGVALADRPAPPEPVPQSLGQGAWLIPGGLFPGREPDGNTVVFEAPQGLIVIDTGRHAWHRQAILALAAERHSNIVAVVNSHWHLDHVSGNPALREAFPQLRVYSSNAIDGALAGFLPSSAREYAGYANDTSLPETLREDIRGDIATIDNGAALRPDEVIADSTSISLGGRSLQIKFVRNAVTGGDVWLNDEQSGVAVLGDLVTFPVPFLDTACPEGWRAALAQVSKTPFRIAVPGHGPLMTPSEVSRYLAAFESFIDCASSQRPAGECAAGWVVRAADLLRSDEKAAQHAGAMARGYVEMLRANGGRSRYCEASPTPKSAN
jgi:glyoxylase-like metal-dependent hydrolase (beta-lactamase superfamily II)